MLAYLLRRGAARLLLLLAAAVAIFLITRPLIADTMSGAALPLPIESALKTLGPGQPIIDPFARWAAAVAAGDLGRSAAANAAVVDLLRARVPVTLQLIAAALAIALAIAIPAGLVAAGRPGSIPDRMVRTLVSFTEAIPLPALALVTMLVFAILLRWLPASGHVSFAVDPARAAAHLVLPAAALAIALLPTLLRAIRDGARDARRDGRLVVARAFGASARGLLWGRMLRLGLAPALVPAAALAGQALSGAILVEAVFDLPGIGRLLVESIVARDYVLLRGLALASVVAIVATALASDLLRGLLDRRVRSAA